MGNHLISFDLICFIVPFGLGSKVLKEAKKHGVSGGTVVIGRGTYHRSWLHLFELGESRREVLLMITPSLIVKETMEALNEKYKLHKPNHGIAFTTRITSFLGSGNYDFHEINQIGDNNMSKFLAIFTIVDKGRGESVVDAATTVGAKGATIINARGSGIHETSKIFNMEIEPEKEIVLMIARHEIVKDIIETICDFLEISIPGNGIIFTQDVKDTYGIL
jgi:nitrogen regulatory protein PII